MKIVCRVISKLTHLFHESVSKLLPVKGRVFMLHWVGDEPQDGDEELYRLSIAQFKLLVEWLKRHNTISLKDWERENDFYALTIDDVPENFYHNAFPILKKAGIPFTLFVNLTLLGEKGYINREQLVEMSQCKQCSIGSHGISHGMYAQFNKEEAIKDLKNSRSALEEIINAPVDLYAYPYGSYYACGYRHKYFSTMVYKYAFGTVACPITKPSTLKKYYLPRINVNFSNINRLK